MFRSSLRFTLPALMGLSVVGGLLFSPHQSTPILNADLNHDERLTAEELRNIQVYENAYPGVVHITTISTTLDEALNAQQVGGIGSGVMIDSRGYFITNYHVVKGIDALVVAIPGYDDMFTAKLVGTEPAYDFAIFKVEAQPTISFKTVKLGDSAKLAIGQETFAIGSPLGLTGTLTKGVISSLNRPIPLDAGRIVGMIQTDASINPGSSGGAMLNSSGELIGINTLGVLPGESSTGLNFAIPINPLMRFANDYINYGEVKRPYLGVTLGLTITPEIAKILSLKVTHGLMIETVDAFSPAEHAGLRGGLTPVTLANGSNLIIGGDVITEINGMVVTSPDVLVNTIEQFRAGDEVILGVSPSGTAPVQRIKIKLHGKH